MKLRDTNLLKLQAGPFDVVVLGGGINGAVSAAALSAMGARVALLDQADFAGSTSMNSSNLAWGGIKYMESFEFPLVRKLCMSRNHLMRSYPSTVEEIRFYTVHRRAFRHGRLKLLAGAWTYWLMGNGFTRAPRLLSPATMTREEPLLDLDGVDGGVEYSDAYLHDNDARFVWNFVRQALNHGAIAANYVASTGAERTTAGWTVRAVDQLTGRAFAVTGKVLVNACGPLVDQHNALSGVTTAHHHVFSKGIHLIVPRISPHHRVLTFFADDGRLFFVIPMGPRTCIGTTDTRVEDPATHVTDEDRAFVLDNINKRLRLTPPLTAADIVAERCGVRPLVTRRGDGENRDWMHMSRKHAVEVDCNRAVLSIFGGKLTDCLNVGKEVARAVRALGVPLPFPRARWYGEPGADARREFFHQARLMNLDGLTPVSSTEPLSRRLWRRYAAEAFQILDEIRRDQRMADLVIEKAEYIRGEIELAARREMIVRLEDFLRRRSKIEQVVRQQDIRNAPGLAEACRILFGAEAQDRQDEYFQSRDAGLAGSDAPRQSRAPAA